VQMRMIVFFFAVWLVVIPCAVAQSPNGAISGIVLDPSGAVIGGAEITVVNDDTRVQYSSKTNNDGIYVVPNVPPGSYRIQVAKIGFKTLIKPDIRLTVSDAVSINFTLPLGAVSEVITVEGGAPVIKVTDGSVSTIVDRNFVENMPLNGRSFQDLILLTPGVVTNSPQDNQGLGTQGEFSVNGQRTESNYYTIDGVSGNFGVAAGSFFNASPSGSLPAATALGTTQALVSVDALQEFRVETSTYSAEFGRNPGGQFIFVTRSGTNQWHGSAFDYLRNNLFDANDWFNDYYRLAQPALRQNDFGGTLGGPVRIPGLYNGKDRTFFFFSYEGLRLVQPQPATVSYVPTMALRQSVPAPLQSVLNAFPLPHCPPGAPKCTEDLGNGLGDFVGTWSNPSDIDATSVRLDHAFNQKLRVSFRLAHTSSASNTRSTSSPSVLLSQQSLNWAYMAGATAQLGSRVNNDVRVSYSTNRAAGSANLSSFGGALAANLWQLQGVGNSENSHPLIQISLLFGPYSPALVQDEPTGVQKQWNVTDSVAVSLGRHQLKFGLDYRRSAPVQSAFDPSVLYLFFSTNSLQANSVDIGIGRKQAAAYPIYTNFSAFAQDEWKLMPRLSLSLGVRWEVNPAPGAAKGNLPNTVQGNINDPATLKLAPYGTPLWRTTWHNLAPRLSAAYLLRKARGYETVVRGGAGLFFDTGQQLGSAGYLGPGFVSFGAFGRFVGSPTRFPAPMSAIPSIINPPVPPYGTVYAFPSHLQLPYSVQWNASIEQALSNSQAVTISYVGSHGARLIEANQHSLASFNANFSTVFLYQNGLTSDYNALQVQYQRRLSHGLQALAAYTWSHSIDYGSLNATFGFLRGNSDFDVRHNFSTAFSYDLPNVLKTNFARAVLHHWGLDDRLTARTSFPFNPIGPGYVDPGTGQTYDGGLDVVAGQAPYLYSAQYPGGRAINPNAFQSTSSSPGNAPRNSLRGFGAWQMDLAVRREFPIHETLKIQFRAEAFNLINHPSFGTINAHFGQLLFGQATGTLAQSLGVLSPIYQQGGPRSLQFALRLMF
jgi:hypothetical protein